jgi:hypothetical protein
MECPKCASADVEQLPPNEISRHPGYQCGNCGLMMRSGGTLTYLFTLLVGLAFFAGMGYMLVYEDGAGRPLKVIMLGAAGAAGAGYSVMQLTRPAPNRGPSAKGPT